MEGKVYYKVKTPNGFLDTPYETLEEAMEIYSQFAEEDRRTIQIIQTMEFQEELVLEDPFDGVLYKPEDIHKFNGEIQNKLTYCIENYLDCKKEEEELEKNYQGYDDEIYCLQEDFTKVAQYAVQLEEKSIWEILKEKLFGKSRPDLHSKINLDSYRE